MPRKKHKRNQERVAVVHCLFYSGVAPKGVFECLSENLAFQKFLQVINFRFTRTTIRLQLVTATRIFFFYNFHLIKNCFLHWKNLLENLNSEQFEECQIRDSFLSKPGGEEKCCLVWLTFFTFATHKKWNLEMRIKM